MTIDRNTRIADLEQPELELVEAACAAALAGEASAADDYVPLFGIEPNTPQAALIADASEQLARRSNGNRGYIYAQLGMDATPCSGGCLYCSFAAINGWKREQTVLPDDDVLRLCSLFAETGVHLISLMTSSCVNFDHYLEMIERVQTEIGPDIAIMTNTRDLSADDAVALRQAGASWSYHAVRLGEGTITGLDERDRWATFDHVRDAGLVLSSAVGPLYQSEPISSDYFQSAWQIANRVERVLTYEPACSGFTRLVATPGTIMEHIKPWPPEKMAVLNHIFQLMAREQLAYGGAGSIQWVDAGLDPRERGYTSDEERIRKRVRKIIEGFEQDNWRVAPQSGPAEFARNHQEKVR